MPVEVVWRKSLERFFQQNNRRARLYPLVRITLQLEKLSNKIYVLGRNVTSSLLYHVCLITSTTTAPTELNDGLRRSPQS